MRAKFKTRRRDPVGVVHFQPQAPIENPHCCMACFRTLHKRVALFDFEPTSLTDWPFTRQKPLAFKTGQVVSWTIQLYPFLRLATCYTVIVYHCFLFVSVTVCSLFSCALVVGWETRDSEDDVV